jgi:hypothetical protein
MNPSPRLQRMVDNCSILHHSEKEYNDCQYEQTCTVVSPFPTAMCSGRTGVMEWKYLLKNEARALLRRSDPSI